MTIFKNLPGEGRESDYLINNRVFVGAEEVLNVESGDGAGPKVASYLNWLFSQLQIYSSPFSLVLLFPPSQYCTWLVLKKKKESGDGYTTLQTYLMPLNRIFTKGKNVVLYILSQFLKAVIIMHFILAFKKLPTLFFDKCIRIQCVICHNLLM